MYSLRQAIPWAGVLVLLGGFAAFFSIRESDKEQIRTEVTGQLAIFAAKMDELGAAAAEGNKTAALMNERIGNIGTTLTEMKDLLNGSRVEMSTLASRVTVLEVHQAQLRKDVDALKEQKKP